MELSTALQILNSVLLALFGTIGWRMVDEGRKSREERHQTELALGEKQVELCRAEIESLKASHKHELEKCDLQFTRLSDENSRLSQKRDDRIALLEEQIEFLKAQAPAGVSANFDALKKMYSEELVTYEKKLEISQSALSKEQLQYEAVIRSKDAMIEELRTAKKSSHAQGKSEIELRSILAAPSAFEQEKLESDLREVRTALRTPYSVRTLIEALEHWNPEVRELAAEGLVTQGAETAGPLAERLKRRTFKDYVIWIASRFLSKDIQQLVSTMQVLTSIGNPAVRHLEGLLSNSQPEAQVRALITLWGIDTEQANEALERRKDIVKKWRWLAPAE